MQRFCDKVSVNCTKWFVENPGFNNPAAWDSEHLPCPLEEVVFPAYFSAIMPIPREVDVKGFVLPTEGALLLSQDSTIYFGAGANKRSCQNSKNSRAYIKVPKTRKWLDPQNWKSSTGLTLNKAIPDMERVPCSNDSVIIKSDGPLSIDLENTEFLRIGQFNLAGVLIFKDYLQNLIINNLGALLFKNTEGLRVEYFRNDICGCHQDFETMVEPICHNVLPTCKRPRCLVPVKPLLSCCPICGAVYQFNVEQCDDATIYKVRKTISEAIKQQKLEDDLDYYVSYVNSRESGYFLQMIVVDRDDYTEKSTEFVKKLNAVTDWNKVIAKSKLHNIQYAGRPYNPNITFGSVLLIILCILFVILVGLVIFAHYAPNNRYLNRIPVWIHDTNRWRSLILRSTMVFSRFDNTTGGAADTDAHSSIIVGYNAESGAIRERAFNNPMYGENPSCLTENTEMRREVSEPKRETKPSNTQILEPINVIDTVVTHEEQELTEIKLDTSSDDESDDEVETIE
ncbi:protein amnionless isoform X2 [Teleopsis dalmanni]|uniref:protein amnionless isoform X2 n=1 Tax=Teleopsis dalmanni TaxID=139649 RepID=UPI0018CCF6EE|nr:protein amnionless isoform X2 [Teleopsis dalmanni]